MRPITENNDAQGVLDRPTDHHGIPSDSACVLRGGASSSVAVSTNDEETSEKLL